MIDFREVCVKASTDPQTQKVTTMKTTNILLACCLVMLIGVFFQMSRPNVPDEVIEASKVIDSYISEQVYEKQRTEYLAGLDEIEYWRTHHYNGLVSREELYEDDQEKLDYWREFYRNGVAETNQNEEELKRKYQGVIAEMKRRGEYPAD